MRTQACGVRSKRDYWLTCEKPTNHQGDHKYSISMEDQQRKRHEEQTEEARQLWEDVHAARANSRRR